MAEGREQRELELRDYLSVLRRRKVVIAATTVVVVGVALALSLAQKPIYRATAEVLLQPRKSEQIFAPDQQGANTQEQTKVQTEIQVMQSRSVTDAVSQALGRHATVDIAQQGQTDVVAVSAEDGNAAEASHVADTYADTYVKTRRESQVNDLLDAATQVQQQVEKIDSQIVDLNKGVNDLNNQIAATDNPADRQALATQRDILVAQNASQVQALQTRRSTYVGQLDNLQLATNLTQTGGAQIVSQAAVPTSPIKPAPKRDAIVALVLGLVLGVGFAFLREYLDDTIKSKDDLESATSGLDVLSLVPRVQTWKDPSKPTVITVSSPKSPAAEAYRALRTAVQFIGIERTVEVLQITSPAAAEGKTTTLANLGVVLARAGKRVVLVDCDLRRPRIESFFGIANQVGFTSVLVGDVTLADAVQPVPGEPRLAVLPSGPPPPNPSELLSTRRTADIIATLRSEADYVLIDCPPVLPVADSVILAGQVDATLLVITSRTTTKRQTQRAVELLRQVDAPLIGAVFNGVGSGEGYGYGYGYSYTYAYGQTGAGRRRWPWRRRRSRAHAADVAEPADATVS